MNRLGDETSPYLRQHMDNPVDWYPWGSEAFAAAVRRDCPVLLSVGYSSCHWCHVMAHESFEDADTAEMMNRLFVNVKVDREERPDVDAVYMESVQAMTGRGGWPMTVFLTPDGRPFFGGTYYPDQPRHRMPSFSDVMVAVHEAWRDRRSGLEVQADRLTAIVERAGRAIDSLSGADERRDSGEALDQGLLEQAGHGIVAAFDPEWGGFGSAPKFPAAMVLDAALRIHRNVGWESLLQVVRTSLDAIASGGIHDHIGGGFARYSVDRRWLVPHFEKMLYDNALLARVYLHAWQVTGDPVYRQVLDEAIEYVLRDLRLDGGGFCSAEDADSEGEEGRFYVWTEQELSAVVEAAAGAGAAEEAVRWWGVTAEGNFEGASILHRPVRGDLIRSKTLNQARRSLLAHREQRVRPGLDDKVLTEWNALMLATLSEAAAATGTVEWLEAAVANGEFLLSCLRREDGRWLRSWQPGGHRHAQQSQPAQSQPARHLAYAHDYAALVDAFTRLGELTGKAKWIGEARACADGLIELFADKSSVGFFTTGNDAEELVTRPKDLLDNATPSAQSLAAAGLLRLARLTGENRYRSHAEAVVERLAAVAAARPTAFGRALEAVDMHVNGLDEIVIAGDCPELAAVVHAAYLPNAVLAWGEPFDSPLWHSRSEGHAYVCKDSVCLPPTADPHSLEKLVNV